MDKHCKELNSVLEQWPDLQMMLSNTVFRWLMVLFVGKFPLETEYLIWDMIMVKGSTMIFRVALTILQLMQQ
jgi:hypothetical protein